MVKQYIEKILTVSSVFFDSIFNNENIAESSRGKILKVFVNLVYAALISIPIGFIIQIIFFIGISSLTGFEVAREINLFVIPLFLFICLSGIIILNYEDMSFSLPRSILNSYIILQLIKPVKGIWKPIVFVGSITITLMLILTCFLSSFTIPEQYLKETIFIIFVISLLSSMILYSEATKEEINRKKRQFIFSMLTFVAFLTLNSYQMIVYISTEPSSETIMFIAITILGLILSMVTAIDKTRCLFEAVVKLKQKDINNMWNAFYEKYSYKVGLKIVDDKKNEINETFEVVKVKWKTGDWKKRVRIIGIISTFVVAESILAISIFNQRKIEYYIYLLLDNIKELVVGLFNGDEHRASISFAIVIIIASLIHDAKKNLKQSNFIYKIKFICRIEFTLIILLVCISTLIPMRNKFIVKYLILPFSILFVVTMLIEFICIKLKEIKEKGIRN